MQEFCPCCGKETKELVNGLCKDCFLQKFKPAELPLEILFESCKNCSKIKLKGKLVEETPETLRELVLQDLKNKMFDSFKTRIDLFEKDYGYNALLQIDGKVKKVKISCSLDSRLKRKTVLCDPCMKMQSSYYEATVQVRFSGKKPEQELSKIIEKSESFLKELQKADSLARIVKVSFLKNGLDLVLGSNRSAKQLAEFLARKSRERVIVSSTLAGVDKSGREWSRFTYCVRL